MIVLIAWACSFSMAPIETTRLGCSCPSSRHSSPAMPSIISCGSLARPQSSARLAHMLRQSCGYDLADQGTDLRTMQDYLRPPRSQSHRALRPCCGHRFEGYGDRLAGFPAYFCFICAEKPKRRSWCGSSLAYRPRGCRGRVCHATASGQSWFRSTCRCEPGLNSLSLRVSTLIAP